MNKGTIFANDDTVQEKPEQYFPQENKKVNDNTDSDNISLTKKSDRVQLEGVHEYINSMLQQYLDGIAALKKDSTPIHVDEIASRLARIYETIRKVVDWKDDNVLRRAAIERTLKRILFTKISGLSVYNEVDALALAETIATELVRGGHLPNDYVPKEVIPDVSNVVEKYLQFLKWHSEGVGGIKNIKNQVNFTSFLLEVAACEVEEILAHPVRELVLLYTMTTAVKERVKIIPENGMSEEDVYLQTFIATCRTLYDLDDSYISYRYLCDKLVNWKLPKGEHIKQTYDDVLEYWRNKDAILSHKNSKHFKRVCDQNDVVFTLLGDFLENRKDIASLKIIGNKEKFTKLIGSFYDKRYQTLKKRLFRLGVFSTLSVFLSNWFTFFIVEVPLAKIFYERFSLFTAFIDFLIPTVVMFILVMIIRPPGKLNKEKVLSVFEGYVYKGSKRKFFEIKVTAERRTVTRVVFFGLYMIMIWIVFTVIATVFYVAGLPLTSVIFDTFTIALTVFAAVVIRNKSKELNTDDSTTISGFILDMISVPIARVGSFIAAKWKEYNVVAMFFNFVVEMPFAILLGGIEAWSQFLKDRKAELN